MGLSKDIDVISLFKHRIAPLGIWILYKIQLRNIMHLMNAKNLSIMLGHILYSADM